MIPLSVTLRGILSHDDTTVDLAEHGSMLAVCGEYGAGKTALIEAPFVALFGFSPFYSSAGSIYDLMTQGGNGDASVEFRFEHGGEDLTVVRTLRDTGNSKTQAVTLWRTEDLARRETLKSREKKSVTPIAGPAQKHFDAWVTTHIGSPDLALATWMMSQSRRGDLCGTGAERDLGAMRREVFDDLIGTARLVKVEEKLADSHRKAKATIDELDRQLAVEVVEDLEAARNALLTETETRNLRSGTLAASERDLEAAKTRLRDAEGGDGELKAAIAEHETAEARRTELAEAVGKAQKSLANAVEKAAGKSAAEHDLAILADLRDERASLNEQAAKARAWAAWNQRARDLRHGLNNKLGVVMGAKDLTNLAPGTRELAGEVESLRIQWREAKGANDARADRNRGRQGRREDARGRIAAINAEAKRIQKELEEKPETPFGAECSPCPLMQKWAALPEREAELCEKLVAAEAALAEVEADEELEDLSAITARGEQAKAAADRVKLADEWTENARVAQAAADAIQAQIDEHAKAEPEKADDPAARLSELQHEIDKLSGAQERLDAAVEAEAQAETLRADLEAASSKLETAEARSRELAPGAASARAALLDRESQRSGLRAQVASAEARVGENRAALDASTREIAKAESRIEQIEARQRERAEKTARVKALRLEAESLAWLRRCYGPKGARQLMIDAAVPDLETIVDQLFDRATGGKFRLRIATQRLLDDGITTAEDFSIRVKDERGERDVLGYSGGQRNLIRILFRIGVLLWHEQISGRPAELLILDEAFDNLGAEGTEALLAVLDHVGDRIKRTIVVTHDPAIAARMPGRIFLTKKSFGVEVNGGAERMAA